MKLESSTSLAPELLSIMRAALAGEPGCVEAQVAPEWAKRQGRIGEHPAIIRGWAWRTPAIAWFRAALLDGGERSQVFSALALPDAAFDLPLFGAEIVAIGGSVTVVALDWMPLFPGSPHIEALAQIRRPFDHFPPGGDLPPWAAASFSPHALFSRPRGAVDDGAIRGAFAGYLRGYLQLCASAVPSGRPGDNLAAQRHYCASHLANDPGATMLSRIFGSEWAEAYSREFLFRL